MDNFTENFAAFNGNVERFALMRRPAIAVGLNTFDDNILESICLGQDKYADITVVTQGAVHLADQAEKYFHDYGVTTKVVASPAEELGRMLAEQQTEGLISGTIESSRIYAAYRQITGENYVHVFRLFEDCFGRRFCVSIATNADFYERDEQEKKTIITAEYMKKWGIVPKIAVFAGTRSKKALPVDCARPVLIEYLNETIDDAAYLEKALRTKGYDAKNYAVDTHLAIEQGCNLIVPVNGLAGNQIIRMILLYGKVLAGNVLGLSGIYEDSSITERDLESHIKWTSALINEKSMGGLASI